jgi:hypothetical protein
MAKGYGTLPTYHVRPRSALRRTAEKLREDLETKR